MPADRTPSRSGYPRPQVGSHGKILVAEYNGKCFLVPRYHSLEDALDALSSKFNLRREYTFITTDCLDVCDSSPMEVTDEVWDILADLGPRKVVLTVNGPSRRSVFTDDHTPWTLQPVPSSPFPKIPLLMDPYVPDDGCDILSFYEGDRRDSEPFFDFSDYRRHVGYQQDARDESDSPESTID